MRFHNSPPRSLVKKPSLYTEEEEFWNGDAGQENVAGGGNQRSHHPHDAAVRGKRGATNQEPMAGSPRAVRARLREQPAQQQQPPTTCGPFAVSRRCSFVERRAPAAATNHHQMQLTRAANHMDSWEPSAIEPPAYTSVGSAMEVAAEALQPQRDRGMRAGHGYGHQAEENMREPPYAPRGHYKDAASQHMRLAVMDARDDVEQLADPRLHGHRSAPLPTPVRARTMATQTNRESMMRHHRENGGSLGLSDGEDSPRAENRIFGRPLDQNVLNSDRSHMTGKSAFTGGDNMSILNTARSVFRDLQYPMQTRFHVSAATEEVMRKVAPKGLSSPSEAKLALGQALACAMNDEFVDLDRYWGVGGAGSKTVEARVATCLKKFAKRAEKKCMRNSLASTEEAGQSGQPQLQASSLPEGTDAEVGERCSQMEAEIAAADLRIARLKEALQRPAQVHESGKLQILSDLTTRLSTLKSGREDVPLPGMAEIANNVEQCIQGLVAANAASRQLYQQCQDEHESLREQNREFCPAASSSQQAPGIDSGARSILRALR